MAGNDFVLVQLTAAGIALAAGQPMRISGGRRTFIFGPGLAVRVERSYEWGVILSKYHSVTGDALCELAPAGTPTVAPAATTAAATPAATPAAATTPATAPAQSSAESTTTPATVVAKES